MSLNILCMIRNAANMAYLVSQKGRTTKGDARFPLVAYIHQDLFAILNVACLHRTLYISA